MPQVFIEFVTDLSKLESATDQIAAQGQISKPIIEEFKRMGKAADDAASHIAKDSKAMSGGIADLSRAVKGVSKELSAGFATGMQQGLEKVTTSMQETVKETEALEGAQKSLKREMKELTAAIAQATLEGKNSGPEFQEMVDRAGEIRDAMGDAAAQINVFASDTAKLDEAIGVITGVAAAFSIAQGATALFGSESEELQEAMVRLQATQSVLMGLTEISNLLEKQSAAYRAATRLQTLAAAAATNLETAAQSKNIVVKGLATVATRVLNAVMSANPAFLLVAAFSALAGALVYFSGKTEEAKVNVDEFNLALEQQKRLLDNEVSAIQHNANMILAKMKERGATEAQLHAKRMEFIELEAVASENSAQRVNKTHQFTLNGQRLLLNSLGAAAESRGKIEAAMTQTEDEEAKKKLQLQLNATNEVIRYHEDAAEKRRSIEETNANFTADQAEKARQAAREAQEKRLADAKAAADKAKEIEAQRLADIKASIERQLLTAEDGSQRQLDLRLKLAAAEKDISAFSAKSNAERQLIYAQYLKNIGDLTTTFHKEERAKALQAQVDTLSAQLASDRIGAQEREALSVELLNRQREIELSGVEGNAAKIKEINARFDRDIAAQRLQIRQEAFDRELLLEQTVGAARKRALEDIVNSDKAAASARLAAVQDLAIADIQSVNKQLDNARRLHDERLLSDADYNQKHAELQDQLSQITENAAKKRTEITTAEADKQKEKDRERVLVMMDVAEQALGAFNNLAQAFNERAMQQFDAQKKALDQQLVAGTITEKEHKARTLRLEREEAAAKTRAAKRDKAMALFGAVIAGARAVVESIKGGPVMIAIAAALAAAQIAAIAARPIPKFAKGTRRAPKGLAIVGEAGPELIEGKGWQYAAGPSLTYFKGGERVYNAKETREIFERRTPMADTSLIRAKRSGTGLKIDYNKLAKALGAEIAKHPRNIINMDEHGFTRHVQQQNSKTTYLNKRYTFGD